MSTISWLQFALTSEFAQLLGHVSLQAFAIRDKQEYFIGVYTTAFLMIRRLIAVLGIVALALAFLPGVADGLSAAGKPACCSGIMCPMHRNGGQKIICDMDHDGYQGAQVKACPSAEQHYTGLVFVPIAPTVLFVEWLVDFTPIGAPPAIVSNTHDVLFPPPRSVLA